MMNEKMIKALLLLGCYFFFIPLVYPSEIVWKFADSPIRLGQETIIAAGDALAIEAGVLILMPSGASISVHGSLTIGGTEGAPVRFEPLHSGERWGGLALQKPEQPAQISYAQFTKTRSYKAEGRDRAAAVTIEEGTAVVEHCLFADLSGGGVEASKSFLTVRQCEFLILGEGVHCSQCSSQIIGNRFEKHSGYNDAIDFDFEYGHLSIIEGNFIDGSEDDGIDMGDVSVIIRNNTIFHASDKGISLEGKSLVQAYNNVIAGMPEGIAVKDSCRAELYHNTIAQVDTGVSIYEKNAGRSGGKAEIVNCVIWETKQSIQADEKSTYSVRYCDLMQLPSQGDDSNFSLDPLFTSLAEKNFLPLSDSPLANAGTATYVEADIRGISRSAGLGPDVGAYEFDAGSAIGDWNWFDNWRFLRR